MADGSVKLLTALDNTGLEKGIATMNKKVASGATKAAESLKKGLKISSGVISAVAGGIGVLAAKGVQYNSQIEQLQTSFDVMLGSASKAKQMIADMNNFAAKTPFQTNDLAEAGKVLMGFGVQGKDVMNTLKMLGDVSQGNAEKLKGLSLVYGQITANGRLQGDDLLQLISNGFNPLLTILPKVNAHMAEYKKRALEAGMSEKAWDKIAADGKVSMAELRDMMSKGAISAQDVTEAFKTVTSAGGMFYNDMEKQSHTFNGQVSTLKDNVNMFLGDLTIGLQTAAKDQALPKINQYMEDLNKALKSGGTSGVAKEFGAVAADAVKQVASAAPDVIKTANSLIKSFADGITDNSDDVAKSAIQIGEALIDGIEETAPAIASAAGSLLKGILAGLAGPEAGEAVQTTMDSIGKAFESLKGPAQSAVTSAVKALGNLAQTVGTLSTSVLPLFTSTLGFAAQNMQTIAPIAIGLVTAFKAFQGVRAASTAVVNFTESLSSVAKVGGIADKAITGIWGAASALTGPVGLAIAAIAGLTLAIGLVSATGDDFSRQQKVVQDEINRTRDSLNDEKNAWVDSNRQIQSTLAASDKQIEGIRGLKKELDLLVDAHGKVKKGEEKHVDTILNLLNPALGTELTRSGEVVKGYDNQGKSIDNLIKKKQALADIEAHASKLQAATQGKQQQEKVQDDQTSKIIATKQQMKELEKASDFNVTGSKSRSQWEKLNTDLNGYLSNYQKATGLINSYNDEISRNQQAQIEISKGNYDKAREILNKQTLTFSVAAGASRDQLASQAKDFGSHFANLKERQKQGDKSVTAQMIVDAQELAEKATQEYQKAGGAAGDGYVIGIKSDGTPIYAAAKDLNAKIVTVAKLTADEAKTQFKAFGIELTDAEANGLAESSPKIQQAAVQGLYNAQQGMQSNKEQLTAFYRTLGIELPARFAESLAAQSGQTQTAVAQMFESLRSGTQLNSSQIIVMFNAMGIQLSKGLAESIASGTPDVQKAAINLVSALESGVAPSKASLASMFQSIGLDATQKLLMSLSKLVPGGLDAVNKMLSSMGIALTSDGTLVTAGKGKTQQTIKTMDDLMKAANLGPPKVKPFANAEEEAEKARAKMQAVLNRALQARVQANINIYENHPGVRPSGGQISVNAAGGVEKKKTLSWLAEEGYPEAIIPFNPARRQRALSLWAETGEKLGVKPQYHAAGGIVGRNLSNVWYGNPHLAISDQTIASIVWHGKNSKKQDQDLDESIIEQGEKYVDSLKKYDELTAEEELNFWKKIRSIREAQGKHLNDIDHKIYDAQKAVSEEILSDASTFIEHKRAIGELDAQQELKYWEQVIQSRGLMEEQANAIEEKIFSTQQRLSQDNYNKYETNIQDAIDFNDLDVAGQLKRWQAVLDDYNHGLIYLQADEVKKIRKNIASLQKQVTDAQNQAIKDQQNNLESRINSLKSWSGIFDEPSYNWETSPDELMWNLKEQVRMMQNWQSDLANLQARGISDTMLKELQDLGPAAADKIHALTEMTADELQQYQGLFNSKNRIASGEATSELAIPSSTSVSVSLSVDQSSVSAVNDVVQSVASTTEQAATAIPTAVSNAVTSGMDILENTVKTRMPTIVELFKQAGTDSGNTYGTAFVERVKGSMTTFTDIVQTATTGAQAQLSATLKAATDTSTAIDSLSAKVDALEVHAVYPVMNIQADGRQIAKAAGPYIGTVLKQKR